MNQMDQCKFTIFSIEYLEDGQTRLTFSFRRNEQHLTIDYQIILGWRLPLYVLNAETERSVTFEFECVGFRFEGDERMYLYPVRYKRKAESRFSLCEFGGIELTDDLETERAIEAVFVPWKRKTKGKDDE